ncbi:MAG: hypothetical protein MUF76_16215, partial [Hydrogenophaga sp.]|nr:hypothetical protein [Hydrogenophaga sp.]
LSILATQSSANSFLGIPAYVALVPGGGLNWLQYELVVPLAMLVVMLVFVPVLRGLQLVSVYEYLERRFDSATRLVLSAVFLLSRGLAAGVALYAAALVVQVCTGLPLVWCVVGMGMVTLVYDTMGGMRAVVWTDVVQMGVLLLGIVVCGVYAWQAAGGGAAILASLAPERLAAVELAHGLGDGARAPVWGFVVGGLAGAVSADAAVLRPGPGHRCRVCRQRSPACGGAGGPAGCAGAPLHRAVPARRLARPAGGRHPGCGHEQPGLAAQQPVGCHVARLRRTPAG